MSTVRVQLAGTTRAIQAEPGATILQVLESSDARVRTGCAGNGACGLCRVRILAGRQNVSAATAVELEHLDASLVAGGVRLACQAVAHGDVELEIVNAAPPSRWRRIQPEPLRGLGGARQSIGPGVAAALDLGTTNLTLSVWDRGSNRRLAALRGPNPQARFGADVVTRLQAACDASTALALAAAVERAVADALREVASAEVSRVVAVGNAAMLALARGSPGTLLDPATWASLAPEGPHAPLRWALAGGREADVELVPALGGFVGSDLLAAVTAADLLGGEAPAVLVDFGTNSEIALWDGRTLWVASAAGGPAFEGSGSICAMPAEPGAIFRVRPLGRSLGFDVIDGIEPRGVCGTGLVDWVACLLRAGILSARGKLLQAGAMASLGEGPGGVELTSRDVDVFQRAKAAIGAGVRLLARRAGIEVGDLRRVVSTGLFGTSLDVANAQAVGLLPDLPLDRFELHDDLALAGCELLLLSPGAARAIAAVRERAALLNLARCPEFEDLFVEGLYLAPMDGR